MEKVIRKIDGEMWLCCPRCGKRLIKLGDNAEGADFSIYCRQCKREINIEKIQKGIAKFR